MLSPAALSNLFTMGVTAKVDSRSRVPDKYTIPDEATRLLRARLIIEEALETVKGLGFSVEAKHPGFMFGADAFFYLARHTPNLIDIIDGCCDEIYVCTGTLCAVGAVDTFHMSVVNKANNAKFIDGKATLNSDGKYTKPPGWAPPNHQEIIDNYECNLARISQDLVEEKQC